VADIDGFRKALPLDREQLVVAWGAVGFPAQDDRRAGVEDRDAAFEISETELRAGQVPHDPDFTAGLLAHGPDPFDGVRPLTRGPVGEVEPEDVDAGVEQLPEDWGLAARGPDGRDDLGASRGGGHQPPPEGRVRGTGVGAAGIGAVTGPVGASS